MLARRKEVVHEQRRLRAEELAIVGVLDSRGALDTAVMADEGVSARAMRETIETARALEALPHLAAAAYAGELSGEQLGPVVQLADEHSDAEWADRAPNIAPADLSKLVRTQAKPTVADSRRRRDARFLRTWWDEPGGMLNVRGALPDVMGAEFEATIHQLVQQMKPAKGEQWDTHDHRAADALLALCRAGRASDSADGAAPCASSDHTPTLAAKPVLVVDVPLKGSATVVGIPLPDAMVEQLRANATIEPVLVDEHGLPIAIGRRRASLSPKLIRAVLLRDGHCRWPGCEHRRGLEVHHLVPRSCGGTDDIANLAVVCTLHHRQLTPNGPWVLTGNPNQPDGLALVQYDGTPPSAARRRGRPPPRRRRE